MMGFLIDVEDLGKSYQDAEKNIEVFSGVSFSVEKGTSLAVLGKSGVGKTSLLNILSLLDTPSRGKLFIDGEDMMKISLSSQLSANYRSKNIGIVFQFHQLLAEFSALENVAMPLLIKGVSRKIAEDKARDLLNTVGLLPRSTHRPAELSGGEQQRIAIARALINDPLIIVGDEPTGNLDRETAFRITDLLCSVVSEQSITLIVATHSLDLAHQLQRVMRLEKGSIQDIQNVTS